MRSIVLALVLVTSGAMAQTPRVSPGAFLASPEQYRDQPVRLGPMGCIDEPKSTFRCAAQAAGQILVIEGSVLGSATSLRISELLLGPCRGSANLTSPGCQFDVAIVPTAFEKSMIDVGSGTRQRVRVISTQIDMFTASRAPSRRNAR